VCLRYVWLCRLVLLTPVDRHWFSKLRLEWRYPHHISVSHFQLVYRFVIKKNDYSPKYGRLPAQDWSWSLNKTWKQQNTKKGIESKYFEPQIQSQAHRHSIVFLTSRFLEFLLGCFVSPLSAPLSMLSGPGIRKVQST